MRRSVVGRRAALVGSLVLVAGCAAPRWWPFGGSASRRDTERAAQRGAGRPAGSVAGPPELADGTLLLPAVRMAEADRSRQGVILRVEGIAATQGFHSPELRTIGRGPDGVETVELRAVPPLGQQAVGPERSRLLLVGRFYSNRELDGIRSFRVVAAGNSALAAPR